MTQPERCEDCGGCGEVLGGVRTGPGLNDWDQDLVECPKCRGGGEVSDIKYGDWIIWYAPPPIPIRTMDWHYAHKDFDGPGDDRHGHGASADDCREAIDADEPECPYCQEPRDQEEKR